MLYDSIIIGTGPAGVSAALNLKILGKNFIWFGSGATSKKVEAAELVRNYPGLPDISGAGLAEAFKTHAQKMGIAPEHKVVTAIYDLSGRYAVQAGDEMFESRTIILCTGVVTAKPIAGEENYLGRGVSYCATCDGFLYKCKTIAVLLFDKSFEHEAEYLATIAQKVYLMPMYKNCEVKAENVEIVMKMPKEISGGLKAERLVFSDGELCADGIFILRSSISHATLLRGLQTDGGHIVVDRQCRTNLAGVFAAGDCTGRPYQYVKAAGEGNVAAHAAVDYLAENGGKG